MGIETIATLDELFAAMVADDPQVMDPRHPDQWRTDLPTFGGEPVADTAGVWSWDATRMIVGSSNAELRIVGRPGLPAWNPCRDPGLDSWTVPPAAQGQIVERAYACDDGRVYRRTTDRGDGSVSYQVRDLRDDEEFEPWQTEPAD
ncbi:MAG: hypothetical protein WC789_10530 [Lentisphaeria bacterium]